MYLCVLHDNNVIIIKFSDFTEFALMSSVFTNAASKLYENILSDVSGYQKYVNSFCDNVRKELKESGSAKVTHISVKKNEYIFVYKHRSVSFEHYCRKCFVVCVDKQLSVDDYTELCQNLLAARYCSRQESLEQCVIANNIDFKPYYSRRNVDRDAVDSLAKEICRVAEEAEVKFGVKIMLGISYDV